MLGLQTPQTGEDDKEEEISCCGALIVNEFLMLYMALAYGRCVVVHVCWRGGGVVVGRVVVCRVRLIIHMSSGYA